MFSNDTHTDHDLALFAASGIDPDTREPRHRPVRCIWCRPGAPLTLNRSGLCDGHDTLIRDALADGDGPERSGIETGAAPGR